MLKYFENKQTLHIIAEIVVLVGIVFCFNSKIKKLSKYIEDLSLRLEQQEDEISNNKKLLLQLSNRLLTLEASPSSKVKKEVKKKQKSPPKKKEVRYEEPIDPLTFILSQIPQTEKVRIAELAEEEETTEINESDLDAELEEEMRGIEKDIKPTDLD